MLNNFDEHAYSAKNVRISNEIWKKLNIASAVTGDTIAQIAEDAICTYIQRNQELRERICAYDEIINGFELD